MHERIVNAVIGAFAADAYALGAHWVYDPDKLENLPIDWRDLNDPQAMWHEGKKAGDFTHYGDQMLFLLESLAQEGHFSLEKFQTYWEAAMRHYGGYIDGATRKTLENLDAQKSGPAGSDSTDLSICGRIAPLLLVEELDSSFLPQVERVVSMTHNSTLALNASACFARMLLEIIGGSTIRDAILTCKASFPEFAPWIEMGLESARDDTASTLRRFGPACSIDGGFAGVIHLLAKNDSFEMTMIKNAQAGGDSSARGMIAGMILGASGAVIPEHWLSKMNLYAHIRSLIETIASRTAG